MNTTGISNTDAYEAEFNHTEEMETMERQATEATPILNVKLNELAAGALVKGVDTVTAVSQLAVNIPIGVGLVTLNSVSQWFASGTETINSQFSATVNRILGAGRR